MACSWRESIGSAANTTPALLLFLTLAVVAVVNLACARGVRRGRRYVRPVVTVVPVAGLVLVVLATVTQVSAVPAGSPWAAGGPGAAILLTIFSQGLPVLGGLAAAGLVWLPSSRRYFRQSADVLPAGTGGT
ncbi:hypothetical protein AR539_10345 [Arthrobacter sp. EPSL27]|nr:hypothetical protein AR539_10345 [Arthrobacter sp. EPSL27]